MNNTVSSALQQVKTVSLVAVYALVTFSLAGLLAGVLPESYHSAILVGWIVALFIGGKLIQAR